MIKKMSGLVSATEVSKLRACLLPFNTRMVSIPLCHLKSKIMLLQAIQVRYKIDELLFCHGLIQPLRHERNWTWLNRYDR
jgi:hypothetical protein